MAQDAMQLLNMLSAPGQVSGTRVSLDAPDTDLRAWLRNEGYTDTDNENQQFSRDQMLDRMLPISGPNGDTLSPYGRTYKPGDAGPAFDSIFQGGYNANDRTYLSATQQDQLQTAGGKSSINPFLAWLGPLAMGVAGAAGIGAGMTGAGASQTLGGIAGGSELFTPEMLSYFQSGAGLEGVLGEAGIAPGSGMFSGGTMTGAELASTYNIPGATSGGTSFMDQLKKLISPNMPGNGKGGGGMNAPSLISSLASLVSGGMGLKEAGKFGNLAAPGNAAADRLKMLMQNPGSVKDTPGYQELLKSRGDALSRRLAAQGYNMSGNERASLAELGGAQYAEFYGNEMDRLSKMVSGATAPSIAESQMRANAINRLIYGGMGAAGNLFAGSA